MLGRTVLTTGLLVALLGSTCGLGAEGMPAGPAREKLLEAGKVREFPKTDWAKRGTRETAHYHLETNLPEDSQQYLAALLEAMHAFYGQKMGGVPGGKMNVFIYAKMSDFGDEMRVKFNHALRPGEGGCYVGHGDTKKRGLYVPWVVMRGGLEPSAVVIHEGFHQFYHALYGTHDPKWFNEAVATYFENAEFDGEKIVDAGKISVSKLRVMQELFKQGKADSLLAMMRTPNDQFIGQHYCEAWSFLYWALYSQKDKTRRAEASRKISTYLAAVRDAKNRTPEAFERITGIKISAADAPWKAFVESLDPADPWGGLGNPAEPK